MKKNYSFAIAALILSASLLMSGCGGKQQEAPAATQEKTTAETTEAVTEEAAKEETADEEKESLAAEKASLEAEIEELRRQKEKEEEPEEQTEPEEETTEAAELSEMGRLGLQDEPFAFEGLLINLPLGFEAPDGPGYARASSKKLGMIYFDTGSAWHNTEDSIRDSLMIYDGFEDFESFEETQIGGFDAQEYSYLSNTTGDDKNLSHVIVVMFPDKNVSVRASCSALADSEVIEALNNSLATIRIEGEEEAESAAAEKGSETDANENVSGEDVFDSIDLLNIEMTEEPFEYEGIRVHFPAGFDIASRYENGSAQIVDKDFSGNYFFKKMDPADPDEMSEEALTAAYTSQYPEFEKLDLYGRKEVNGLDLVFAIGRVPTKIGHGEMYLCYGFYFLEDKVVYLTFGAADPDMVTGFLATLKTAEKTE